MDFTANRPCTFECASTCGFDALSLNYRTFLSILTTFCRTPRHNPRRECFPQPEHATDTLSMRYHFPEANAGASSPKMPREARFARTRNACKILRPGPLVLRSPEERAAAQAARKHPLIESEGHPWRIAFASPAAAH